MGELSMTDWLVYVGNFHTSIDPDRKVGLYDFSGASRLSIEGYVRRVGRDLQFGSGYVAHDGGRFESSGNARVVANAGFDSSRGLRVESIQSVNKFPGASMRGGGSNVPGGDPIVPDDGLAVPGGAPPGLGRGRR